MPKLSVLICTFRRPELLKKAVKSVQMQGFKEIEIIISDDNSRDHTPAVAGELAAADGRIRYLVNSTHRPGPNGNKNNALDAARGDFVCFLDDDDELLPGALSELMEAAKAGGWDHVFGNCLIEREGVLSGEFSGRGFEAGREVFLRDFLLGSFSGEFFGCFRRTLLGSRRFDEELFGAEALLWVHLYAGRSLYIHKPLRIYRLHREDSVTLASAKHPARVAAGYLAFAKICEGELQKSGDDAYRPNAALHYRMAALYFKLASRPGKFLACLLKSLKIKITPKALALLPLAVLPRGGGVWLLALRKKFAAKNK